MTALSIDKFVFLAYFATPALNDAMLDP